MIAQTRFKMIGICRFHPSIFPCLLALCLLPSAFAQAQQRSDGKPSPRRIAQRTMRLETVEEASQKSADEPDHDSRENEFDEQEEDSSKSDAGNDQDGDSDSQEPDEDKSKDERQRKEIALSHLVKLQKSISEIRISTGSDVAAENRPLNRSTELLMATSPRLVTSTSHLMSPPSRYPVAFYHRPLYFQQPDLERCGRTYDCGSTSLGCLQNAVSGITFVWNTMILPYRIATERPDCPVPHQGDCLACQSTGNDCDPLREGRCGLLSESAAIAGFTFLLL